MVRRSVTRAQEAVRNNVQSMLTIVGKIGDDGARALAATVQSAGGLHTTCKAAAFVSRLSRERIELDRGSGGHQFESCTVAVGSPRKQRARQKALPVTDHLVLLARVR